MSDVREALLRTALEHSRDLRLPSVLIAVVARLAGRWVGSGVTDHWSRSVATMRGTPPTLQERRAAVASYTRYWLEMITLSGWNHREVNQRVVMDPGELAALQRDVAGPGCVVAMGHLANWDLAGAFSCFHGMPVSTVAERLPGPLFEAFVGRRERLGFRVHGHRDPGVLRNLVREATDHRLVCLLADRNLGDTGVEVRWPGGATVVVPAGPAVVARRAGAVLRPLTLRNTGAAMRIRVHDPIRVGKGTPGLTQAMQEVANVVGAHVRDHPEDWHVFQPFFA